MEEQSLKSRVCIQARDFVFKMFNNFKRNRTTVVYCAELQGHNSEACGFGLRTVQRPHSEENCDWNKAMVTSNNMRTIKCLSVSICVMG
jgi:hypothetical protein